MKKSILVLAALTPTLAACADSTGPAGEATVAVRFATAAPSRSVAPALQATQQQQELRIQGTNGTLVITDMRLLVAEFELKRDERVADCDASGTGNLCRRFEAPAFLLSVPLGGGEVEVVRGEVPQGTYTELEFEVEDLEEDDDDTATTRQGIAAIRQQLAAAYPGVSIPREASMFVRGRFIPTVGAERPFLVLFDAEIEVELDLVPPLVVTDAGASRVVTVNLDPAAWFVTSGQVRDLSALDFVRTGRVPELEVEISRGVRVETD